MANVSTVCYGSPGIGGCTEHKLICTEPLAISITNITFGYRQGCVPVSSCINTTCCREQPGDCFTPYNQTLLSQLQQTCNGRSTCTLYRNNGLDERSSYCFNGIPIIHSYSKIEYLCTTNELPTPASDSTTTGFVLTTRSETDTYVGAIVGGIVGLLLVIGIVGVVIFFIKRRLNKLKSQTERQYDSPPTRVNDQPTAVYYSVNTRLQTDEQTQYINEHQLSITTNGQTPTTDTTQDYEHAYDSAPSEVTDGPRAVYDSLNTREQTGYYNMGNIDTTDDSQFSTTDNGRTPINTNNQDYEHTYSTPDRDTNGIKAVYDSLNTREHTGYYNMGNINTNDDSVQPGTANEITQNRT
ncbi:uncharacterized protein LOC126810260 [Patella vulgata]|uniref:uncharacterized protein LOC126810260 n=1 Tax=Patella vulgata TaxID=6465 RepID=UPI00218010CF|nr:uncharacterized protein LOC126810260 [Patella vulgata]